MKKSFNAYIAGWCTILGLFNVITFVTPGLIGNENKYDLLFWVSYALITLVFVGQLVCAYFAFQADSLQKTFYNLSLIKSSVAALIAMLVVGGLCMVVTVIPNWAGIVACSIVLAISVVSVIKATVAIEAVSEIDQKVKAKTFFVKSLTVDAEELVNKAESGALRITAQKVYEAFRYSDPMSTPEMAGLEEKISDTFAEFAATIDAKDAEGAEIISEPLLALIDERNAKCKIDKK